MDELSVPNDRCYTITSDEYMSDYLLLPEPQILCLFKLRLGYSVKGQALTRDDIEGIYPAYTKDREKILGKVLSRFFELHGDLYIDRRIETSNKLRHEKKLAFESFVENEVLKRLNRAKAGLISAERKKIARLEEQLFSLQNRGTISTNLQQTANKESANLQQNLNKTVENAQQIGNKIPTEVQQNGNKNPICTQQTVNKTLTNRQQTAGKESTNCQQNLNKTVENAQQIGNKIPTEVQQNVNKNPICTQQTNNKEPTNGQQNLNKTDLNFSNYQKINELDENYFFENKNSNNSKTVGKNEPSSCVSAHTRAADSDADIYFINKNINKKINKSASESAEESKNLNSWNTRETDSISEAVRWLSGHGLNPATAASFEHKNAKNAERMRDLPSIVGSLGAEAEEVLERCRQAKADKGDPFEHAVNFVLTSLERRFRQRQQQSEKYQKSPSASAAPKRFRDIDYREGIQRINPDGTFVLKPRSERMP